MRRSVWCIALCAAVGLVSVVVAQELKFTGRADLRDRFVLAKTEAYGIMAPDLIAGPTVTKLHASPLGRYLLVEQTVSKPGGAGEDEARLSVYDRRSRFLEVVWRYAEARGEVQQVVWLAGTDTAFVVVSERPASAPGRPAPEVRSRLLRLTAASSVARPVPGMEGADSISIDASPSQPYAVVELMTVARKGGEPDPDAKPHTTTYLLRQNGTLGPQIHLPQEGIAGVNWTSTGEPYIRHITRDAQKKARIAAYSVDVQTGRTAPLSQLPKDLTEVAEEDRGSAHPLLRLNQASGAISEKGVTRKLRPLWLESKTDSEQPRALVCPDATWASLTPKGDAVLYISQRSAWVAPLLRLSKMALDDLYRKAVMDDAKTVGVALQMYAQDYDEQFPLSQHFSEGAVNPYAKSPEIMEGFRYEFPGVGLSEIKKPGETSIGSLPGPGGQAVVYADGSVKWKPDPK